MNSSTIYFTGSMFDEGRTGDSRDTLLNGAFVYIRPEAFKKIAQPIKATRLRFKYQNEL